MGGCNPPPMCVLGWGNSMCGRGLKPKSFLKLIKKYIFPKVNSYIEIMSYFNLLFMIDWWIDWQCQCQSPFLAELVTQVLTTVHYCLLMQFLIIGRIFNPKCNQCDQWPSKYNSAHAMQAPTGKIHVFIENFSVIRCMHRKFSEYFGVNR